MFGRGQDDVDDTFGLPTRRIDRIEYDVVPRLQGRMEHMSTLNERMWTNNNRIAVVDANITIVGREGEQKSTSTCYPNIPAWGGRPRLSPYKLGLQHGNRAQDSTNNS